MYTNSLGIECDIEFITYKKLLFDRRHYICVTITFSKASMSITEERLGNAVIRRPIKKGYSHNVLINLLYIQSLRIKSIIESLKGYQLLREKS